MVLIMPTLAVLPLSLLLLSSFCYGDRNHTYHVNSSSDLEYYLCDTTWSSQYIVLLLSSSVNFTISPGNFCQVTNCHTSKIEICSDSPTESATIICAHHVSNSLQPRRGLAFLNSTVILKRLVFKNCGTYLTTIQDTVITDYLNSSSLHYTSFHAAALVFVHCQVYMTQVNMYNSYGFAMIGVNLYNSTIDSVGMSNSSFSFEVYNNNNQSIGSGLLLHYINTSTNSIFDIWIKNIVFSNNIEYNTHSCLTDTYFSKYTSSDGSTPIVNAAGLTILYTQQSNDKVSVQITESYFYQNIGSFAGGMFVLQYHTFATTNTTITNTVFDHNINIEPCHGAAVVFYWLSLKVSTNQESLALLYFFNTSFLKHEGISQPLISNLDYGAVYINVVNPGFVQIHIDFICCKFNENFAASSGISLYANGHVNNPGNVYITLNSTVAVKNSQNTGIPFVSSAGIFYFHKINRVDITGTSNFSNNYGSVIESQDSNVYLSGELIFHDNHAMSGPAINLRGNCQLYFMSGVIAKFINNWAQLVGGAIYAEGVKGHNKCVIQIDSNVSQIVFSDNEAKRAGSSIYAHPIFSCYINNSNHITSPNETMAYYNKYFNFHSFKSNTTLLEFSTTPKNVKEGTGVDIPLLAYPGQKIYYCISAIDALGRNVYSTIAIDIVRNQSQPKISDTTKLWLSYDDQEQLIQEKTNCTIVSVTAHTSNLVNVIDAMVVFSLHTQSAILKEHVKIHPCPLGFELNEIKGICELSSSFYNFKISQHISDTITSNLTSQLITRLPWAGIIEYMNGTKGKFGVSPSCPFGYCDNNYSLIYFYSGDLTSNQSFKLSDGITDYHPPLCLYQREGTLCGRCSEGLSVVFGSTECHHCNNAWLATISIYLVAGPLFIFLLYALRLTLTTGTLNGIIFYAQAANCGLLNILKYVYYNNPSNERFIGVTILFLRLLNLDTVHILPLCFFNGMTELWKAGLSLIFPIYLLTIVVVLIIFSRFSIRLSNKISHSSVQVLVTIVHLSFSNLLLRLINVLAYAEVYTSDNVVRVWYFDGNVKYGGHSHCILMIVTLIVVVGLLLPYILLLLFVKPLRPLACTNKYLRPLLEAIHAPYKEGKQYWFTLRLLLLCAMYIIYAFFEASDVYILFVTTNPMLLVYIFFQAYIKPFKNKLVHILDCWLMMNLAFLYLTTWYFVLKKELLAIIIFNVAFVFMTLVTFIVVIIYHILWVMGKEYCVKRWFQYKYEKFSQWYIKVSFSNTPIQTNSQSLLTDASGSFYGSCSEFREPVLGHSQ